MWDGIDRRRFPRAHYKCLIRIMKREKSRPIATYTENIGAGGLCVIVNENLGLFQGVSLELDLEDTAGSRIACTGTVVWVVRKREAGEKPKELYDTGIEFIDIKEEDRKRISVIVDGIIKKSSA